ncbi:GntR family transcriptional regulator [Pseudolysinimonas yzui]|uniref:GntR family transcriptional regulator n=1 Tax=Pseudolysinimonas yzui TaxID=2708254 RepID=A0A8J3DTS9_9MICO|nr:GntR family transcriptional regulator [Pseudolysinimonas yzui]GHF04600.1 GntR family transcriptional regulator [Pseudolysinimonas yzui]
MSTATASRVDLTKILREAIVSGEYAPNQRLIEADLSASYGASRAAVRTALLELAAEGLVDRLPNRGSRVRAIPLAEAIEILEVRISLEGLCAAKAAENITDAEIAEFTGLRADILKAAESDLFEYSRLNQLLDRRIREIAHHPTAVGILERLRAQGVRHQFRLAFYPGRAAVSAPEHAAIIDAIIARDPARAEAETRRHLGSVIQALRSIG